MRCLIFVALFAIAFAVGGWKEVSVEDERVVNAAKFATKSLSQRMNSPYHAKLSSLNKAKRQIVAGVNYELHITIGYTTCKKSELDYNEVEKCDFQKNSFKDCKVKLFHNLQGKYEVKHFDCSPTTSDEGVQNSYHEYAEELLFEDFIARHNKLYLDDKEKLARFKIFQKNLDKIKFLNDHERGTARYGVTKFADLTEEEFKKHALGLRPDLQTNEEMKKAAIPKISIPDSYDWRDQKVVSEVKDQGQCGSCWAFSTTGNIEGQWAIKKKSLVSLSEQELVDCDKLDQGCNGGLPSNAYKEIMRLGGLEKETDYPYEAEGEKCAFKKGEVKVYINDSVTISKNETEMAQWLVKNGPISIGINANAMQFYYGGISHPWKFLCDPGNLDHGVLIVGYGVHTYPIFKKTLPFWIIKNSWGASWGEQGYYRVYRGDGTCGVNQMATSAVVD
ncbi:cathepsin L-like [Uloborus diversus]|uniref:cathepsin L-like n=1 Tax=Uloborus diversus TaxID=327109 RepID=UPI00240962AA|nr:cathepsin L-like [Uloborus diversus]